jgi:surfeit locus 1 family protein
MQFAGRRFSPSLLGVVLTIVVVTVCARLGFWQLERAEEKQHLMDSYERGADRTVRLTRANLEQLPRYQQVEARGRYDGERQVLLDNMPSLGGSSGRPGYHVWTLLRLEEGGVVLVNRGWVPMTASREHLPAVPVSDEMRTVVGRIDRLPEPGVRLAATEPTGRWPEVLYYPTSEELSKLFGEPIPPRIVLLDPKAADGYERVWQRRGEGFGPERHIGYAVQWFALATAAFVIFIVVNLKKVSPPA